MMMVMVMWVVLSMFNKKMKYFMTQKICDISFQIVFSSPTTIIRNQIKMKNQRNGANDKWYEISGTFCQFRQNLDIHDVSI